MRISGPKRPLYHIKPTSEFATTRRSTFAYCLHVNEHAGECLAVLACDRQGHQARSVEAVVPDVKVLYRLVDRQSLRQRNNACDWREGWVGDG
jgi:hypothetical protein